MEPLQPQQQQTELENGNNKTGGLSCRQTSTRWTPTTDQIRILKDLYYNGGVRSPTAEQIQKISARLRQYGKIEGKNVFYWFQNHKARERQKKRFNGTTAATPSDHHHYHHLHNHHHQHQHALAIQRASSAYDNNNNDTIAISGASGKLDQDHLFPNRSYPSFSNGNFYHASPGAECAINPYNGYIGGHGYGGSMTVEKQFMDCSISPTGGSSGFNVGGWVNMDHHYSSPPPPPPPPHSFLINKVPKPLAGSEGYEDDEDDQEDAYVDNRRTLPLFPMHGEDHITGGGGGFWRADQSDGDRRGGHVVRCPYASLELSLNSYTGVAPD